MLPLYQIISGIRKNEIIRQNISILLIKDISKVEKYISDAINFGVVEINLR